MCFISYETVSSYHNIDYVNIDNNGKISINTLRQRQNGCHFPDNSFTWIFLNENIWISIEVSLKFVPKDPINNIPALVQIMAWCRPGDKPLSEPMMVSLLTHIYVTWPQWVKRKELNQFYLIQPFVHVCAPSAFIDTACVFHDLNYVQFYQICTKSLQKD